MQFNSFLFLVFFSITYLFYTFSSHRWQNLILLIASYFFYASWDYRFLSLILFSTAVNYLAGRNIGNTQSEKMRKLWLIVSISINLSLLCFFKYYNFFVEGFSQLLSIVGLGNHLMTLHIILPVGISFYTFQAMSYTIDVYKKEIKPTSNYLDFSLYISFFPQLVAGPIERATHFLPQICSKRTIDIPLLKVSIFLFLYGLFEKVVVADNLSLLVDQVYDSSQPGGFEVLLATYGFAFQIFADFDGYSNMAQGLAGLMGFRLVTNFNAPYFSQTPSEFWSRWHISLSTWLKDYLYIPLGGNRFGGIKTGRNLIITMLLAGLWHGASLMFLLWGAYHALLLVAYRFSGNLISNLPSFIRCTILFHLVCLGWMIFRSQDYSQFIALLEQLIFDFHITMNDGQILMVKKIILWAAIPVLYQYFQIHSRTLRPVLSWPVYARVLTYVALFYFIIIFGFNNAQSFIYFQF